jgi:hypothetical protein
MLQVYFGPKWLSRNYLSLLHFKCRTEVDHAFWASVHLYTSDQTKSRSSCTSRTRYLSSCLVPCPIAVECDYIIRCSATFCIKSPSFLPFSFFLSCCASSLCLLIPWTTCDSVRLVLALNASECTTETLPVRAAIHSHRPLYSFLFFPNLTLFLYHTSFALCFSIVFDGDRSRCGACASLNRLWSL